MSAHIQTRQGPHGQDENVEVGGDTQGPREVGQDNRVPAFSLTQLIPGVRHGFTREDGEKQEREVAHHNEDDSARDEVSGHGLGGEDTIVQEEEGEFDGACHGDVKVLGDREILEWRTRSGSIRRPKCSEAAGIDPP